MSFYAFVSVYFLAPDTLFNPWLVSVIYLRCFYIFLSYGVLEMDMEALMMNKEGAGGLAGCELGVQPSQYKAEIRDEFALMKDFSAVIRVELYKGRQLSVALKEHRFSSLDLLLHLALFLDLNASDFEDWYPNEWSRLL